MSKTVDGGFDHNFCVRGWRDELEKGLAKLKLIGTVVDPVSGRAVEAKTTKPGFQFYTSK